MIRSFIKWLWRSAITGRFVTKQYADEHKAETYRSKRKK